MSPLGKNIRFLRRRFKLSQAELGEILHKSESTIQMWETGFRSPTMRSVKKISEFFNIDITELVNTDLQLTNGGMFTLDHIIPISASLENGIDKELFDSPINLQYLTQVENAMKSDKIDAVKFANKIIYDKELLELILMYGLLNDSNKEKIIEYCKFIYQNQKKS